MRRLTLLVALVVGVAVALGASGAASPAGSVKTRWVIRGLGALHGSDSGVAFAINDRGQVVGWSIARSNAGGGSHDVYRATLWESGKITNVVGDAQAYGINNHRQVVGMRGGEKGYNHAFLWRNGKMIDLGRLALPDNPSLSCPDICSSANGINDRGQIVGVSTTKTGRQYGFAWQNGKMTDLGTSGGSAINGRGQVVGAFDIRGGRQHAFLWQNGKLTDLGTLGGPSSEAVAINDRGQVVGQADTKAKDEDGDPIFHGFLWENGRMRDLGGGFIHATAINNRGQIVGYCDIRNNGEEHGCLWENGRVTDLGTLAQMPYSRAYGINNRGQIVGESTYNAVLWTLKTGS